MAGDGSRNGAASAGEVADDATDAALARGIRSDDPDSVRRALRRRGERVRRRERDRALERLESTGELTEAQRRAVDELSASLATALLERPEALLATADGSGEEQRVARALSELFLPAD